MINNMTMLQVNIHELKARLSELLDRLREGEILVVCRRNVPVAELRRLPAPGSRRKRVLGRARGEFTVPGSFFEPLPDSVVDAFEGRGG
jgi:antitoxin (DNA-binding transcriptional repressor) of toxin-antitoxin stability system